MRILANLFALLVAVSASAQVQDFKSSFAPIIFEIRSAGLKANTSINDKIIEDLMKSAGQQNDDFQKALATSTSELRVARFAEYFKAKSSESSMSDAKDFHWLYLTQDFKFSPINVKTLDEVTLQSIDWPTFHIRFGSEPAFKGESILVVPSLHPPVAAEMTLTFESKYSNLLWTGIADDSRITLGQVSTSKGCEIDVRSSPSGAKVLFNGREWPHLTNTKSIRDPGKYEIIVKMEGYSDWTAVRFLHAGSSWTINATLERQ